MKKNQKITAMALMMASIISVAGLSAQISGTEVMENVYNRPAGEEMNANLVMTITNSRGSKRERSIIQYSLETSEKESKIMFFTAPADVRDTSFMTWSWEDGRDDDQWIYLPALRRVKRISSDSKNDSFMGSDFTYDDLGERHPSEDRHSIIGEETIGGEACYIVESVPVGDDDAFSKTISWIIKDKWIGLKKDFYDNKNQIYKNLTIDAFDRIDGFWIITDMTMTDLDRNNSTRIEMRDVSFNVDLDESFFSERQMKIGPRR